MKDLTEKSDVWAEEIAKELMNMCSFKMNQDDFDMLKDTVYWIDAAQQNPYERDSWRVFYNVLADVCGMSD